MRNCSLRHRERESCGSMMDQRFELSGGALLSKLVPRWAWLWVFFVVYLLPRQEMNGMRGTILCYCSTDHC